ncbi:hypothetical protein C8A01DRAFT_34362 [Parachaetomium inaequale]|uniref:DUF4470 domain-containing protein n=1 Tax=Parachaetomium inaequale TaxID=2588326 RepID=A0AAN6PJ66_9PEZI|nr:hypothetical protein C8A01DRAFT_34362 [Parachaetomium inaequale]
MLTPGYAILLMEFYPIGNMPAMCLTQGLPPEKKADILLLGCGDVQNILFTAHCDGPRQMDITCCDAESSIIARNILLLTLILGDQDRQRTSDNWNIHYHVFLNQACHDRLLAQTKKLQALSISLETWRGSEYANIYGKLIRFCDRGTLASVAEIWAFYVSAGTERQAWLKAAFGEAIDALKLMKGDIPFITLTGLRSATPAGPLAGVEVNELHDLFWRRGNLHFDSSARSQATLANPMFVSPDATVSFTTALTRRSRKPELADVVAAAQAEFSTWSSTLRGRAHKEMTLRFFVGDALLFCHTLQHRHATGSARTAFCYRSRHNTMDPLVLVEDDYCVTGTAPVSNVIDTTDLIDQLGALNLLAAASPLLAGDASSCLYTDTLVPLGTHSQQQPLDQVVGGHLATTSLLLGLFPIEYWTNTSPLSIGDEQWLGALIRQQQKGDLAHWTQLISRITWKRPPSHSEARLEPLHMEEGALASLLYQIYVDMFPDEHRARTVGNSTSRGALRHSLPLYTRLSFVALLRLLKGRVVTDWGRAMDDLLARIESNVTLMMGKYYLQELYLSMHLLDIHSVDTFKDFASLRAKMGIEAKCGPA